MSGAPGPSNTGKAIASLAKMPTDTTRAGTQKMKFIPTLPVRRKKEEVKQEPSSAQSSTTTTPSGASSADRGGSARGGQGRGRGRGDAPRGGRGAAPPSRLPPQEMTASGPFAMGPSQVGSSAWRGGGPRISATSSASRSLGGDAAALGTNLTKTAAPTLKKERGAERPVRGDNDGEEDEVEGAEAYSDPDEGVEIVDMRDVRAMDWMAPESLKWKKPRERTKKAVVDVKREEEVKGKTEQEAAAVSGPPAANDAGDINLANALDLSESEEEEDMEDIINDFSRDREDQDRGGALRQERLYFFQFPTPFPTFVSPSQSSTRSEPGGTATDAPAANEGGGPGGSSSSKRVSFSVDTKPPAPAGIPPTAEDVDKDKPPAHVDGVIGQLEIYQSGAVKMRLANGILLDVTAATQPSFLQQVVHVDRPSKDLRVLGEVSRRFVVSPDIDTLLAAMTQADEAAAAAKFDTDGLLSMDTT